MTNYNFCDIVLVTFPFTDITSAKKRPAVIVSSDMYNRNKPNVIIMDVTIQTHDSYFGDTIIQN